MQKTELLLPFMDQWLTFWGGDTLEINQHHNDELQKYAFDFIQVDEKGGFFKTNGKTNDDYYSFGKPILTPADGVVIEAVDGIRDNNPGEVNNYQLLGNYVLIQHTPKEFSLLAHLKNGGVTVNQDDKVNRYQQIGACGNSGNSSDPHLHYHLQSSATFNKLDKNHRRNPVAVAVKALFSNISVQNRAQIIDYLRYSPVKGDLVRGSE